MHKIFEKIYINIYSEKKPVLKIIFYFSILYIMLIGSILSFYTDTLSEYKSNLTSTTNKINGVNYLKSLHKISMDAAMFQGYMVLGTKQDDQSQREKSIEKNIEILHILEKNHTHFYDETLDKHLTRLKEFKMGYNEYYDFFDYINHENYIIGNKAEILFSQNRQRYFLGTLMTHYLPEFFISIGILHNILKEFVTHESINDNKKNIFIEHNKLVHLSSDELFNIIGLLSECDDTQMLSTLIEKIQNKLKKLKEIEKNSLLFNHSKNSTQLYLNIIYEVLELAEELNYENTLLLETLLENDKKYFTDKILYYQLLLIFMILLVTAIFFYFFNIFLSNIKKDKELELLNNSLKQRVLEEVKKNRQKDQQLLHQSRLAQMGEMISMISHQWRQPLAAISATSASIELKASLNKLDNETAEQKAHDISNFSQHLSRTIDDFRNFFKPNKEKSKITYDEIIKSVLNIVKISITNKNIELHTDLHCHNRFMSYPNELQQVVLNLIKNAEDILLEKMVESPFIKIKTYQKNNTHILEVSDNGGGVPETVKEKIFDPYFSTKTQKEGSGLGLYMSKMIIEEHCGGKLDIFNSSEGAMFRIKIKNNENS